MKPAVVFQALSKFGMFYFVYNVFHSSFSINGVSNQIFAFLEGEHKRGREGDEQFSKVGEQTRDETIAQR